VTAQALLEPGADERPRAVGDAEERGDADAPVHEHVPREHAVEPRADALQRPRSIVGLATATAAVGLDIEQPRSAVEWEEISDLAAHPADDAPTPLHAWTAKEAVLKLLGMGLSQPIRHVRVADGAWHLDGHVGRLHWEDLDGCALGAIATHGRRRPGSSDGLSRRTAQATLGRVSANRGARLRCLVHVR
jgi:hypothetical protein